MQFFGDPPSCGDVMPDQVVHRREEHEQEEGTDAEQNDAGAGRPGGFDHPLRKRFIFFLLHESLKFPRRIERRLRDTG